MQVFENKKDFLKYIDNLDPLEDFETKKRKINWKERDRICESCEKPFVTRHPLTKFCDNCRQTKNAQ